MFELKPLSREAIPAALEKAMRYRLLNEPMQAESICLDVLEVDPENQEALVTLILALTDQFEQRLSDCARQARDVLSRLPDPYHRAYYEGILWERQAKAHLKRGGPGSHHLAYEGLRQAMEHYEDAMKTSPPGNDDAVLRWNTCARIIMRNPELKPAPEESTRLAFLE